MQTSINDGNIFTGNRTAIILVIVLLILTVVLFGVLYFTKQKESAVGAPKNLIGASSAENNLNLKKLLELTSAPENNPDIVANPILTNLTTSPDSEESFSIGANPELISRLTAPKQN